MNDAALVITPACVATIHTWEDDTISKTSIDSTCCLPEE